MQADLSAWWPILNTGGIFAGHDYATLAHPGVTKAVHEFAIDNGLTVYHTRENNSPRSWYMLKTEADE